MVAWRLTFEDPGRDPSTSIFKSEAIEELLGRSVPGLGRRHGLWGDHTEQHQVLQGVGHSGRVRTSQVPECPTESNHAVAGFHLGIMIPHASKSLAQGL